MKLKNKKKLVDALMDQVDGDDGMQMAEIAQDAQHEASEAAERVLKANGYTGEEEDFGDLVDELAGKVTFVPSHWALTKHLKR